MKRTMQTKSDLCCILVISQNLFVVKDAPDPRGVKVPSEFVLERDASPTHQQNKEV